MIGKIFKSVIKSVLKTVFSLLPLKDYIIFESHPDFSDNTYWLYKYLVEEIEIQKDYKLIWFVTKKENEISELCGVPIICINKKSNAFRVKCRLLYYNCRAKVIIDCNDFVQKMRDEQIRIYLGHGMPLKMADEYMSRIGACDLLTITGEGFRDYYNKFVPDSFIRDLGYPRNDILLKRKGDIFEEKRIVWMPTYRQHKIAENQKILSNFPLGLPIVKTDSDWTDINKYLFESNCMLYLRPHPAQDLSIIKVHELSNIVILNDKCLEKMNTTLYEVLAESSALITDYSSVYYDYLFVDRPIGVTFEDAEEFSKKWKFFIKDIKKDLPGCYLDDVADLKRFICDVKNNVDRNAGERNDFKEKLGIKTRFSAPLIWSYLKQSIKMI